MNKLKKAIAIGTTVLTLVWTMGGLPVNATTYIADGDLVKAAGSSAVYYIAGATKRVFPHANVYLSWGYPADYSSVKTVSASELAAYTDGNAMPFRDGSLFRGIGVGLQGYAKEAVYYIEDSKLRPVKSADIYQALFKDANWVKVTWVPDDLLTKFTYPLGTMIETSSTHPDGTIIQYAGTTQKYLIDNSAKRAISDTAFAANRYLATSVLTISADEAYADGTTITGVETGLLTPGWAGTTGVTSALSVSLSSDNPTAATVPMGASNVFLLKSRLTAGTSEAVVTGLTFKRTGVGATADWSDLYLYEGDTRITPVGRTLSSDTHTVEFTALSITVSANSSKTITLRGDILCTGAACATTHATASDQHAFSLTGVETTATVTGLPVAGNTMVIGSQNIGTATVAVGTTPNAPSVGQLAAEVASFKVTNDSSNNDITFDQLVLTFTGSIARSGLTNFKLYQAGETNLLATASGIASNDTLSLTLTTPFTILKGQNRSFSLKADVAGRVAETAKFFIDQDNHIVVTDKQYGFGAKVTNNYATGNAPTLTLKGGTITFADNGPTVGNIGKNQQDVVLTKFSLTPNRSVEVRRLTVTLCADNDATFNNADGEVADLRIKDADTGTTLMSGTVSTVGIGRCAVAHDATLNPITYSLTNAFNASAGITKHLAITVDLAADTVNHMTTAGLKLRANLGMTVYDATHSYIRDTATGDYIVTTDIVPTTITGDDQTVLAASLTPTIASTPVSGTFVKGSTDVASMGLTLTATDAATVNVRRIKAWVYAEDDTTFAADEAYSPSILVSSVKLYEEGNATPLATRSISYTTGADYGEVDFDGLNINVTKGTNKKLTFKTDLSTSGETYPYYYYIGVDNDNITAYDADGNLLTITGDTNTGIAPSVYITVSNAGTLTMAKDAASPANDIVIAGTSNVVMSKFKFTANTEDITVDKLRIDIGSSTSSRSVTAVKMAYTGGTATGYLSSGYVTFSGMNWLIKKDVTSVITISADLNTIALGATSGDTIELGLACSTASNCNAVGASGNVLGDAGAELSNVDGNTMYLRKTKPTIALVAPASPTTFANFTKEAQTELGTFVVTADAAANVEIAKLQWTLITNGAAWKANLASTDFQVWDTSDLYDELSNNEGVTTSYTTSTGVFSISWADANRPAVASTTYLLKVDTLSTDGAAAVAVDSGITGTTTIQAEINTDAVTDAGADADFVWDDDINTTYATLNGYLVKNITPLYTSSRSYKNN